MTKIRVPATSANLGPGFDVIGIALQVYNDYELVSHQEPLNLADQAFSYYYQYLGRKQPKLSIKITNSQIPISRGLGSSASLIVAGLALANLHEGGILSNEHLLSLATDLEGHPDNVAPAIFGGFVASQQRQDKIYYERFDLDPELTFTAIIPDQPLSTEEARRALPKEVTYDQAIFNMGNAILLSHKLYKRDYKGLKPFFKDKLHQPHRGPLIPLYKELLPIQDLDQVYGFYISGAGSTMIALNQEPDLVEKQIGLLLGQDNYQIKHLKADNLGIQMISK